MRVALFVTCLVDAMFPQAGQATVELLERLGVEVDFPEEQGCCGQMHINTGFYPEAIPLLQNHAKCFEPLLKGEWDYIVTPSGSCSSSISHQGIPIARELGYPDLAAKLEKICEKSYEITTFLVDVLGLEDVGAYFPHRVTYHPSCHSHRIAMIGDRPYTLLRNVEGIDFVELPHQEECCGFGGTFSMKNGDVSGEMLSAKLKNVMASGAEVVCTPDYSCLMNIAGGVSRQDLPIHCMHIVEILASTKEKPFKMDKAFTVLKGKSAPQLELQGGMAHV